MITTRSIARRIGLALALTLATGATTVLAETGEADDDVPDAAPLPPPEGLTPAQVTFRQKLVNTERDVVSKFGYRGGGHVAQEDRVVIGEHWRHVMRLLRIRELAEQAKDTATVAKCDDLLAKADKWLQNHAKPAAGGAK